MSVLLQVERRVVNQLASAFEQGLVTRGSHVRLAVGGGREGEGGEGVSVKLVVTDKDSNHGDKVDVGHVLCPLSTIV